MIEEKTTATIQSNLVGEKIDMQIAESATSHIMDVLSKNLYSDPELAVLREYSTNALDAQIEAGVTRPIEVTLPSHLSPFLVVRDFGIGLDEQGIREIYSQYGESTKRGTNDQTGMLGLGCKSAFAYTSQFTVTSVKDGRQITVVVSRDDDGTGSMTIADESDTDEVNGTTVTVPAKRFNSFAHKAAHLFSFWPEGSVLVNGEAPKRVEGLWLNDKIVVIDGNTSYIVMGGVPYPVTDLKHEMSYGNSIVAFVPMGAVEFMASREALRYTAKTKAYIEQVEADFREAIKGSIQRAVDAAATPQEAIKVVNKWVRILPKTAKDNTYTYNGKTVPSSYDRQGMKLVRHNSHKLNEHQNTDKVMIEVFPQAVWVTGYDRHNFSSATKKKLKKWAEDSPLAYSQKAYFIMLPVGAKPPKQWIEDGTVVDWPTINAIKLPRATGLSSGRLAGSYDIYEDGDVRYEVPADEVDTTKLFYYVGKVEDCSDEVALLSSEYDTFTVVTFYQNRLAKFKRSFPNATPVRQGVQNIFNNWAKGITKADRIAMKIKENYDLRESFKNIDPTKVNDPAVKRACKLAQRDVSAIMVERRRFSNVIGRSLDSTVEWQNPLTQYPLFDQYQMRRHADHIYLYMNAVYAARQESK